MPFPLATLIPAALAGGFVVGKIALSGGLGGGGSEASGGGGAPGGSKAVPAPPASSHADTTVQSDLWGATGDTATIDFGPGRAGVLQGIGQYAADPFGGGGLPGDPYAAGGFAYGAPATMPAPTFVFNLPPAPVTDPGASAPPPPTNPCAARVAQLQAANAILQKDINVYLAIPLAKRTAVQKAALATDQATLARQQQLLAAAIAGSC